MTITIYSPHETPHMRATHRHTTSTIYCIGCGWGQGEVAVLHPASILGGQLQLGLQLHLLSFVLIDDIYYYEDVGICEAVGEGHPP